MNNIPKIVHLYWDGSPMSYLQYLTVISLKKLNSDWDIYVYTPKVRFTEKTWITGEQSSPYIGKDFWPELKKLNFIKINEFDFSTINISNTISEVFKSDFIRWHLLSTIGGVWSDFDILYLKPLNKINFNNRMISGEINNLSTAIVFDGYHHIIGFYLSVPNNQFFSDILKLARTRLAPQKYQSVGSSLLMSMYPKLEKIKTKFNNFANLSMSTVYPFNSSEKEIREIFFGNKDVGNYIKEDTIGIHWYNGSNISKEYLNNYDENKNNNSIISKLIKEYDINSHSILQ